mgnify:CR=1 FL=1
MEKKWKKKNKKYNEISVTKVTPTILKTKNTDNEIFSLIKWKKWNVNKKKQFMENFYNDFPGEDWGFAK